MGFLGDLLFGTEKKAANLNQQNVDQALALLKGVPLEELFGQQRAALEKGRADIETGFRQGIAGLGAAGTGAQLDILAGQQQSLGALSSGLAQRGLYGSSVRAQGGAGIRDMAGRSLAGIQGQVAGAQGGLAAQRGLALSGIQQGIGASYGQLAGMGMAQAGAQAQVLTNTQHQGHGGIAGPLLYQAGSQAVDKGMQSVCCFLAVAVDGLPLDPSVREYRDARCTRRRLRGYYRLSEWIVPRMRRPRVHGLVRHLLVRPLTAYARWWAGRGGRGWALAPVAAAWCAAFGLLGLLGPVRRSNGEAI
jgi:hypothetical protein